VARPAPGRARRARPARAVSLGAAPAGGLAAATGRGESLLASRGEAALPVFELPFERETTDGDRALSYATWPCPPACIEPLLCPHTRGGKDWSLAGRLAAAPEGFDDAVVFRSLHLVHGVGTIPVADIHAARRRVLALGGAGERRLLVATASHCHGLATSLTVRPRR
jgi:hypothetical protein